jgi:polar amino acid transport system substrate-binding protein
MPLRRAAVAALLTLLLASCVPPEGAIEKFDPETPLGAIQQRGELIVGIETDNEPFGYIEHGAPAGWTVDIAREVARRLGVELRVIPGDAPGLMSLLDARQLDVAFPALALTEETLRTFAPSDPYWVGHQRWLVPEDSEVAGVPGLAGRPVCAALQPGIGIAPHRLVSGVKEIDRPGGADDTIEDCERLLQRDRVEAITASDFFLISVASGVRGSQVIGDQATTEGYGAISPANFAAVASFVDRVLEDYDHSGAWQDGYRKWIVPIIGGDVVDPPTMTVEEAGALYPLPRPTG